MEYKDPWEAITEKKSMNIILKKRENNFMPKT